MKTLASILSAAVAIQAGPALADSYSVHFVQSHNPENHDQYRLADVDARVTPLPGGVVGLFRNHEDTGLPNGWATFIYRPRAAAADGRSIPMTYLGGGRWRLEGWSSGPVEMKYMMLLQHDRFPNDPGDDEMAYARPYGVMWTGRALLMEGAPARDIPIQFDAPADWKITTQWAAADTGGRRFIAASTDDLLDSAFMAGTQMERDLDAAGGEARIAVGPPLAAQAPALTDTLRTSLAAYRKLFGADMPGRLLVVVADGSYSGGGVMGRSISFIVGGDRGDADRQARYIVAHEAFHLWPHQWRLRQANGELEWLKEGLAEYYANLVQTRTGQMSEEEYVEELARRAGVYLTALRKLGVAEGGSSKLNGGEDSYNIVYSGGMMAALVMDADIRAASGGRRSLDDVMAAFEARYAAGSGPEITLDEVRRTFAGFGVPASTFTDQIEAREPLPLARAFDRYGLVMSVTETPEAVKVTLARSAKATAARRSAWKRLIAQP